MKYTTKCEYMFFFKSSVIWGEGSGWGGKKKEADGDVMNWRVWAAWLSSNASGGVMLVFDKCC